MQFSQISSHLIFILGCLWADICLAQPEVKFNLLTLPTARAADVRLAMPAQLNYQHAPLRLCMQQLAERFQFSYWIDRRVDVDRPLTVSASGSLRDCLLALAAGCDVEMGLVENVVTIAPPEHLASMQYAAIRLHDQLMQAAASAAGPPTPARSRSSQVALKPLQWEMLTTPNQLLDLINQQWQTTLPADLPHDLFNAGSLQACTLATQVTLLLGGFDRCAAGKQATQLRVVRMPPEGLWQATYSGSQINSARLETIATDFPSTKATRVDRQWQVVAVTGAHLRLLQPHEATTPRSPRNNRPSADTTDPPGNGRYTIARQAGVPIGAVLENLAQQLGLKIQWDDTLPPSAPQTAVTIEANNSKLDEILDGLGAQAKLSITRQGLEVIVTAPQ